MRSQSLFVSLVSCVLTLCTNMSVQADEEKPAAAKGLTLSGTFEAVMATEVSVGTEKLSSLVVSRIVPHGTKVRKGQNVVWIETEDIDRKIRDAETAARLSQLTQDEAEFDYEQFKKTQQLDRQAAERTRAAARQTHDNYVRVDRDRSIASAEFNLHSYEVSLENALEELKQLEQMYKEDELTEESEEIVLKRAKNSVESARFRLEGSKIQTARAIGQSIPREAAQQEDAFQRAEMAYQKALLSLNLARQRQDIEIAKKREALKKELKDVAAMKAERAALVVRAPHDGLVYHGELNRGKLSDKPSSLKEGSTVTGKQVLATIVDPRAQQIRVDLTEALRAQVVAGTKGTAKSTAFPDTELKVVVKSVGSVPLANNKFDCVLTVQGDVSGIAPGTTCVVRLNGKQKK